MKMVILFFLPSARDSDGKLESITLDINWEKFAEELIKEEPVLKDIVKFQTSSSTESIFN